MPGSQGPRHTVLLFPAPQKTSPPCLHSRGWGNLMQDVIAAPEGGASAAHEGAAEPAPASAIQPAQQVQGPPPARAPEQTQGGAPGPRQLLLQCAVLVDGQEASSRTQVGCQACTVQPTPWNSPVLACVCM